MQWPPSRRALIAAGILIAALGIRVGFVQLTSYKPVNDAGSYLKLAAEVAKTGGYSNHDAGAGGSRGPSAYFPPGFPYYLGVVDLVDGHATRRGPSVQPARISQAVLGTISVGMLGLVALELFSSSVALIAMGLAAIYPVLVEQSGTLVAENLLVPLMLAAIWAVLRSRRSPRPYPWIVLAGVLTGLSALTHENALLLIPVLGIAAWTIRPWFSLKALGRPVLLVVLSLLTIAPWTVRNAIVMHRFIPISDETGITLAGTYNPESAAFKPVPYKWRLYYFIAQDNSIRHEASHLAEPVLGSRLQTQALNYIGAHPFAPLAAAFHNTLRMFELEGSYAWQASYRAMGLSTDAGSVGIATFWLICLLAIGGAFTGYARRAPLWLWAVPILFAVSVVLVNVETPRFREPVEPFLVMLAACGIAGALRRARSRRAGASGDRPPVGREGRTAGGGHVEAVDVGERLT